MKGFERIIQIYSHLKLSRSSFYTKVSRLQLDMGNLQLKHHERLQQQVYGPLGQAVEEVFPVCEKGICGALDASYLLFCLRTL